MTSLDPLSIPPATLYQHLIRLILPRPIAWVSTLSLDGTPNLAPFSFFTGVGSVPPTLAFCPANRRDGRPKDTLVNILARGEFVVNLVPFALAGPMNQTAAELEPEHSEFLWADLETAPSMIVGPPRVGRSPASLECRLLHHLPLGAGPGGANLVVGEILHIHLDPDILDPLGLPDPTRLDLIGRLGGQLYCRTRDAFELPRPDQQMETTRDVSPPPIA
ncbi:MAG: flavin reductase family protein [Planctomycetota bacterium]